MSVNQGVIDLSLLACQALSRWQPAVIYSAFFNDMWFPYFLSSFEDVVSSIFLPSLGPQQLAEQDKSVPWQLRVRRSQALQRLGQIFFEVGVGSEEQTGAVYYLVI